MSSAEYRHGVWLHDQRVGVLHQRDDHVRFVFDPDYWQIVDRPIMGMRFEEHPQEGLRSSGKLPPWFSNLLPESEVLRNWIAQSRGVRTAREMELLAEIGHDLPGAVRIFPDGTEPPAWMDSARLREVQAPPSQESESRVAKFSLAGVGLKFSLLKAGDRLTIPGSGHGGDWIVKMPDARHRHVPQNEYAMMALAGLCGISVPEISLMHRSSLPKLPDIAWPNDEDWAYAIRRFDRDESRCLVHIEDMAQVRGFYPDADGKYSGSFETVAGLFYRGRDLDSLYEFARRLTFNIMIGNGDAHLKNWSLLFRDGRIPTISPAYDLVATFLYDIRDHGEDEDLGLTFMGGRDFNRVRLGDFVRLGERLRVPSPHLLREVAEQTVDRVLSNWTAAEELLKDHQDIAAPIAERLPKIAASLRKF